VKIKIIKNAPIGSKAPDISKYIGMEFDVANISDNGNTYHDDLGIVFKGEYEIVSEIQENNFGTYHISWLKKALINCDSSSVSGNMTMDEFIKMWCAEDLDKVIKLS